MIDLLEKFCAKTIRRSSLATPFTIGEHTYATDGRICIRVSKLDNVPFRDDAPDPSKLEGWKHGTVKKWMTAPTVNGALLDKCDTCKGAGKVTTCAECDGDGSVWFENEHNDYDCECKSCFGDGVKAGGVETCESCDGEKFQSTAIKVGEATAGSVYLKKVAGLPGAEMETNPTPLGMICFRFEGGEGILMSRRD